MNTVFITGIGQGIGQALAQTFLEKGYEVMGTYLSAKPQSPNPRLSSYRLDLSSTASIRNCARAIHNSNPAFDVYINNAGALFDEDETEVIVKKLRQTLEVNVIGTIDFTERMLPLMKPGGHLINVSSTAGSLELAGQGISHHPYHYPCYKISKAAINMYTRTLAHRLKPKAICVSSVHPGWVKTAMGGPRAELAPATAAQRIADFAMRRPRTGGFWYAGKPLPW